MKNKFAKGISIMTLLMLLVATPSPALAVTYTSQDPGYIQNVQIQVDGVWYNRPGLDSFPVTETLGPFNVQADFGEGSFITSVRLGYGFFLIGECTPIEMDIANGKLTSQIPEFIYPINTFAN